MTYEEAKTRKGELEKELEKKRKEDLTETSGIYGIGVGRNPKTEEEDYIVCIDVESEEKGEAFCREKQIDPDEICITVVSEPGEDLGICDGENGKETDDVTPDAGRYRPMPGGIRISAKKSSYGTMACFVKYKGATDGKLYMLSNQHVMDNIGNMVCQPAYDSGNKVGKVTRHADYTTQDAAIAELYDNEKASVNEIQEYGRVEGARAITEQDLEKIVIKRGARTRLTRGIIRQIDYTCYLVGGKVVRDCVKIDTKESGAKYSRSGDSGSPVVVEEEKMLVGLHFAGPSDDSGAYGICCKITNVFDNLGVELP